MTSKVQLAVPKEVGEALGLESGDRVVFEVVRLARAGLKPSLRYGRFPAENG